MYSFSKEELEKTKLTPEIIQAKEKKFNEKMKAVEQQAR